MNWKNGLGFHLTSTLPGIIFMVMGILKMLDPVLFSDQIVAYRILPHGSIVLIALVLPWFEFWLGLCFAFKIRTSSARLGILCLLSIFIFAIISALLRKLNIHCGCWGRGEHSLSWALLQDLILWCLVWIHPRFEPSRPMIPSP